MDRTSEWVIQSLELAQRQLDWPFDRRTFPIYWLMAGLLIAGCALLTIRGFTIAPVIWLQFFTWPLLSIIGGMGLRRLGYPDFGGAMEGMGLFYWQGLSAFFCIVPLASLGVPFADATLSSWDHALGFDWVAFAKATAWLHDPFAVAYKSFVWQPALAAFALFMTKQAERGWQMVLAAAIALGIATFVFALFPAVGASEFYHFAVRSPAAPFHPVLMALKDGSMRVLDKNTFAGMISFPSYHAAAAAILTWGCWTTYLRWPMLALNILMCISAITMGSHYFVDILGGLAVAAASIAIATRMARRWMMQPRTLR